MPERDPLSDATSADAWHGVPVQSVLERLHSRSEGLDTAEAERRTRLFGPNVLVGSQREGFWRRLLRQFQNVLIYILLVAAAATGALGEWLDMAVILAVVVINAMIGYLQEGRAERALESLRGMLTPSAHVLRGQQRQTVNAADLVPGDIVELEAGDRVAADLRLLRARNLQIEQSALTGESVPADKTPESVAVDAELAERSCMAYAGTLVTAGEATGVVVATGNHSEIGRISGMLSEIGKLTTPLLEQMNLFGRRLSMAILAFATVGFLLALWLRDYDTLELFLAIVALIVAAVPEGLPAVMTIILALGVQTMARRSAIVRRLPAVETLGEVNVICADKTGTLTRNEMTVRTLAGCERELSVTGSGYNPAGAFRETEHDVDPLRDPVLQEALQAALLCNDARIRQQDRDWLLDGDPTEGALLVAAVKAGLDRDRLNERYPRLDLVPFSSERRYMATLHKADGERLVYMKGAPERMLSMCSHEQRTTGPAPLNREAWQHRLEAIASRGQRVLAVARRTLPHDTDQLRESDTERQAVLLALFGILDPPREEAIRAVDQCLRAGIRVKMITGDHALTARAIASQLGIDRHGHTVTGHELDDLEARDWPRLASECDVFARSSPEHKLKLVKALQSQRLTVAMTGDGVNDAPALKRADVGVAMSLKGTEVAREASEMVLMDDNFASIAAAVEEGRRVYDNLTKAVTFLLPTSTGEALTIFAALLLGLSLPLTPVQVLWVNMVTAVTLGLVLGFEPAARDVMDRPPRPREKSILSVFLLWRVIFVACLLLAGSLGFFLWLRTAGAEIELARTVAINALVIGETVYLFNNRSLLNSVINRNGLIGNPVAWVAVAILAVLQLAFTYTSPMQALFETTDIGLAHWLWILLFGLALFLLVEAEKALLRRWKTTRDA